MLSQPDKVRNAEICKFAYKEGLEIKQNMNVKVNETDIKYIGKALK